MEVRSILPNWFLRSPIIGSLIISSTILIAVSAFTYVSYKKVKAEEKQIASQILTSVKDEISQTINTAQLAAHSVSMFIDNRGVIENFDSIAQNVLDKAPVIRAIQLVPKGVITKTFPVEGNECVQGLNLFSDPESAVSIEAKRAIVNQTIYFAGPLKLKQGGNGVIGRLPVYRRGEFWGFVAVIINTDRILDKIITASAFQYQYVFSFSKTNPRSGREEVFLGPNKPKESAIKIYTFSEADWKLSIYNSAGNSALYSIVPLLLLGIILATLGGILTYYLTKSGQKQFQDLFETSTVGILIHDKQGNVLTANKKFHELFGYSPEKLKAMSIFDLHGQGDYSENLGRVMYETILYEGSVRTEDVFLTQEGRTVDCELSASLINFNGVNAVQLVFRDISDLKRMEKERIAILESITDGFFALSNDGEITFKNKTATELFASAGSIKPNIWEIEGFSLNNQLRETCQKVMKHGNPITIEMFCGEFQRWLSFTVYPAPSGLTIYFKDITSEKLSQEDIKREHNKAILAQSQLLSAQLNPHFIFNVLNSIQYYILDKDVEPALNFLSLFSKLVRRILYNSRKPFISLDDEIQTLNTYLELEKLRSNRNLEYMVSVSEDLDDSEEYFIPPMLVQPYVENSIVHAFDPTMEECKIEVSFSLIDSSLVCSIRDNGVGINERLKQKELRSIKYHKSMATAINKERIDILNSISIGEFKVEINDLKDEDNNLSGTEVLLIMPTIQSDELLLE